MSAETDIASAIGQCVSAAAGVLGLGFIGVQIRAAWKTSDLQALQTFLRDVREHDAALVKGPTPADRAQAFVEYLNFLEVYATAANDKLFGASSRKIVIEKLIDSIALIAESTAWHSKFEAAITTATTFSALHRFMGKHRAEIRHVRASQTQSAA